MSNNDWQAALSENGAIFEHGVVTRFKGNSSETTDCNSDNLICDLSHLALLEISGEDAVTFLQGQLTNDVKQLNGTNAHLSAYCTAKGRMLALFLAFAHQHQLYLQLPQALAAPIAKRLGMYVLRAKVHIRDLSDTFVRFGINGPRATDLLATALSSQLPAEDFGLLNLAQATIIKLPTLADHARYEIICSSEMAFSLWNQLQKDCKSVGKPCWDWLEIQAGIPEVTSSTQEQFVPQMLNLDLLNGISFKKGCYTGQEIVARTHYLGTVKRRTFLAHVEAEQAPQAGDKLFDSSQNEIGMVVRSAASVPHGFDLLVELRTDAQQANQVFWTSCQLAFKSLPYSLEAAT